MRRARLSGTGPVLVGRDEPRDDRLEGVRLRGDECFERLTHGRLHEWQSGIVRRRCLASPCQSTSRNGGRRAQNPHTCQQFATR